MNWIIISQFQIHCVVKKKLDWILPVLFNWRHLYTNRWFLRDLQSDILTNVYPRTVIVLGLKNFYFKFFRLKKTFCLCLRHLNLTMTQFHFFKWYHQCSFSRVTVKYKLGTKFCKHFALKFHPQDFLEQGLLQVLPLQLNYPL